MLLVLLHQPGAPPLICTDLHWYHEKNVTKQYETLCRHDSFTTLHWASLAFAVDFASAMAEDHSGLKHWAELKSQALV